MSKSPKQIMFELFASVSNSNSPEEETLPQSLKVTRSAKTKLTELILSNSEPKITKETATLLSTCYRLASDTAILRNYEVHNRKPISALGGSYTSENEYFINSSPDLLSLALAYQRNHLVQCIVSSDHFQRVSPREFSVSIPRKPSVSIFHESKIDRAVLTVINELEPQNTSYLELAVLFRAPKAIIELIYTKTLELEVDFKSINRAVIMADKIKNTDVQAFFSKCLINPSPINPYKTGILTLQQGYVDRELRRTSLQRDNDVRNLVFEYYGSPESKKSEKQQSDKKMSASP